MVLLRVCLFVGDVDVDPGQVGAVSTGLGSVLRVCARMLENKVRAVCSGPDVTGSIRGLIPDQPDHTQGRTRNGHTWQLWC